MIFLRKKKKEKKIPMPRAAVGVAYAEGGRQRRVHVVTRGRHGGIATPRACLRRGQPSAYRWPTPRACLRRGGMWPASGARLYADGPDIWPSA